MGRAVKNSLEIIIIKQVRLEGGFERGGRIRVAECLRQIVPLRQMGQHKKKICKAQQPQVGSIGVSMQYFRVTECPDCDHFSWLSVALRPQKP